MPSIRSQMSSSYIPGHSSDAMDLLEKRLQEKGVNYSKGMLDVGSGESGFQTPGLLIEQTIRGGKRTSGLFFGGSGELYTMNPKERSFIIPVTDRATLNGGRLNLQSAVERAVDMISNPFGKGGPRALSSLALEQGAPGMHPGRLLDQPGIGNLYAHAIQLGGEGPEENSALQRMIGPNYLHHADNLMMYREADYQSLPPMGSVGGLDRLMMRSKVSKSLRQLTGNTSQVLSTRGDSFPMGPEPFFAENQAGPNFGRVFDVSLGVFAPLGEGQGYVRNLRTAVEKASTFQLPRGTTYNKITDADGIERNSFEVPGVGTLTEGGFFGRSAGKITEGLTRYGGASDFRDIFGKSMRSYPTMLADQIQPVMDNGAFTGSVQMSYRGLSLESSWKDASLMKLGLLQTNADAIPLGADIFARFPEQDRLPAFAMQSLKGELRTSEAIQTWFQGVAKSKGYDDKWVSDAFKDGQFSKEGLGVASEAAISRVLNRLEYHQRENIDMSPMVYDALKDKRFVAQMDEATAKGITGATWLGGGRASVPVFDPSDVTPVTRDGETIYRASKFNDLMGKYKVAGNLRPEFAREQMSLTPSTLNIMSQYNPQLFNSLMQMAPELQKRNRAYNIVSSYRANYSPEARTQLDSTFGVQSLDLSKVASIRQSIISANKDMTPAEVDRETLNQLKGVYGKSSLSLSTPQGDIVLPHAGALSSGLVSDSQGGFLSSFSQKATSLIMSAAGGQDITDMVSETMSAYGRYANQGGVIERAGSLQFPSFGGIAHGAEGVAANEIVANRKFVSKLTGISDPKKLQDMAENGTLAAAVLRYPFSNPREQFQGARIRFYDEMSADFQKKFKNPQRNFYVSNEIQAAEHGDFDIDRVIGMVNYRALGAGRALLGGALKVAPGSEIIKTAMGKIEPEYQKFKEVFDERDNFDPRDWAKHFMDHNNIFPVTTGDFSAGYRNEEASTGGVGIRYNTILRRMGGTVNRSTQAYGPDAVEAVNKSMAILNSASTQGLLDKLKGSDESLDWVTKISAWGHRVDSTSGTRFTIFPPNGEAGSTEGTDVEGFYQKAFQKFTDIGSGLTQDEYERTGIGRSVAGLISNRTKMTPAMVDDVTRLLNLKHEGKASYEDVFAASGADLSAKNPLTGIATPYSKWGLSGESAAAETVSGALSFHKYRSNARKGVEEYPDWDTSGMGKNFGETEEFLQGVENVRKKKGNLKGFLGGIAGAFPPMQTFLNNFFPGDESGSSSMADRFYRNPKDISSGGVLNPSSWTYGTGADDRLMRITQMSTNASERSGVLKELFNMGMFSEYKPYNGTAREGDAAGIGKRMEQIFSAGSSFATDISLPPDPMRRTGKGIIDLLIPHGGSQLIADIKTKNEATLQSDILGPQISSQIGGQLALYMEGLTEFTDKDHPDYGSISGQMGAVIFGQRPDSPNPTTEQMIGGFETAYNKAQTLFNQTTAPAGFDPATWDDTRKSSLELMDTIYNTTGMKVGARTMTAAEAQNILATRQADAIDLPSLNTKYRASGLKERAEQIAALMTGKPVPHMPVMAGGAAGGAGGGSSGGGVSGIDPDDGSGSGGGSVAGGGGLGGFATTTTVNNFKTSMPKLSTRQIGEASVAIDAMNELGDAAKKLASPLREIREEYVKHYDAIKEIVSYSNRAQAYSNIGAKENAAIQSDPSYQAFNRYFGAGRAGGSIMGTLSDAVNQLQQPAIDAEVQNIREASQGGGGGFIGNILNRAIKGQGLFHAHLAWNMIANPAIGAAREYQQYQAENSQALYTSGGMNYDQLMSGYYGTVTRRGAMIEQAQLAFGQQVNNAYAPYINAAISPQVSGGVLGALAGIAMPAAAAAIGTTSLTGSPLAGGFVGGVVGLAGVAGYMNSAMHPEDIRGKLALGQQAQTGASNFQGGLGYDLNNISDLRAYQQFARQMAANGQTLTDSAASDYMRMVTGSGANQENRNLYNAVNAYMGNTPSPLADRSAAAIAQFYNAPLNDVMAGAYDLTLQKLGFSEGLQSKEGMQLIGSWMNYHKEIPTDEKQLTNLAASYHAGIDPTRLALARAGAQGISPYSQDAMASMQERAAQDLYNAQLSGKNINLEEQRGVYVNSLLEQVNSSRRQAGLNTYLEGYYSQYADNPQYGPEVANAIVGVGAYGGQVAVRNPEYFQRFGQNVQTAAQAAFERRDFTLGNALQGNMVSGEDVMTQMQSYRMNDGWNNLAQQAFQSFTSPAQIAFRDRFMKGDAYTISQAGQMFNRPEFMTVNPQTGTPIYYNDVPQMNIDYLRKNDPMGLFSDQITDEQARGGTLQWGRNITNAQRSLQDFQYFAGKQARDIGYNLTTGNLGAVQKLLGSNWGQADPRTGTSQMGFDIGNGMGYWQLEDAGRVLNRTQQRFSYDQETQQLAIQQQNFNLAGEQFNTNWNLQQRQLNYQTQFQQKSMNIDRSHQITQFGWQQEDLAYSRNQLDIHFAWGQEDYQRNIRYARGMEKRNLMREQGRAVIQYGMEAGQSDRQQNRLEEQKKWADEAYDRQKQYFEQNKQFQREALDNQKRFFDQGRILDQQRLDLQKVAHDRQLIWMQEEWRLEDQRVLLDRQHYQYQYNQQVLLDTKARETTLDVQKWSDAIDHAGNSLYAVNAKLSTFQGIIDALVSLFGGGTVDLGNTNPGGGSSGGATGNMPTNATKGTQWTDSTGKVWIWGDHGWQPAPGSGSRGTTPGGGGYSRGGFTGYGGVEEVAGVVHKGQHIIPQGGSLVMTGSDPALNRVIELLEKSVRLQSQMASNPTNFTAVVNGNASKAVPIPASQTARARIS